LAQKPPTQVAPPAQSFCVAQVNVNGTQAAEGFPAGRRHENSVLRFIQFPQILNSIKWKGASLTGRLCWTGAEGLVIGDGALGASATTGNGAGV
jgi:hypothetical protein